MGEADEGRGQSAGSGKVGSQRAVAGPSSDAPVATNPEVTEVLTGPEASPRAPSPGSGASSSPIGEAAASRSSAATPASFSAARPMASEQALSPGFAVGRYEIVELLGSGGMGSVYRAHDPHLSRDIALKVLHQRHALERVGSEYRHRLLREAQALAKLSHPNVVAAFDVGTLQDVVFVAMELVQGESLRDWLRMRPSQRDVLRVLIAAGRGLVAAHAAGVLHRDFKPGNVMVSPDGRVRVVDFGLARSAPASVEPGVPRAERGGAPRGPRRTPPAVEPTHGAAVPRTEPPIWPGSGGSWPPASGDAGVSLFEGELTEAGRLMGTPGYIAPEQLRGEPADVLADQYSYAVTAFVALTGQKPPVNSRVGGPSGPRQRWTRVVPARVRRVIERGLAPPSERYPSVAAMVDALEQTVAPRRRAGPFVALALGAGLIALTVALASRPHRVTCQVSPDVFRELWGPERRAALSQAFTSTGRANAAEAFGLLARRLDVFQGKWLAMRQESCEATHLRGEQSERVLGLRSTCLDAKLRGVGALVSAFDRPDAGAIDRAAGALPDTLDECSDTAALLGTADQLPADPAARAAIEELESAFGVTRALAVAGQWKEAGESGEKLLEEARALGHAPTIARALRSAAFAIYSRARTAEERRLGETYLREAIPLAAKAGDDRLVASTSSYLFNILAYAQRRVQEAEAMLPHVDALVIRAGDRPEDRLEVLYGQARIMSQRRKLPEAIELFDQVIRVSQTLENERRTYAANAEGEIGEIYIELERYPEAVRRMEAAVTALERIYGSQHPRMLIGLANLALAQSKTNSDAAGATVVKMRVLAATLPTEDWRAVTIPFLEGQIREDRGDCASALPFYRDALARFAKVYGANAAQTADVHERLGACLLATGARREALAQLEQVLSTRRATGGTPNAVAAAAFTLAQALASGALADERVRAFTLAEEARASWQQDGISDKLREVDAWIVARGGVPATSPAARTVASKN